MKLPGDTAEDFASFIAENKPYLIEIEDEIQGIQKQFSEAKIKLEIHIRGHNVVRVDFWRNRHWERRNLTQLARNDK